ncbi:hypothetical protein [Neobacillus soli]|uniref:hypothetical protein n=1 Tax=Neobacillus soli TaxID=220688 RepID=UPI000823FCB8|nr:hypothetical protein [Neobacillus soli]
MKIKGKWKLLMYFSSAIFLSGCNNIESPSDLIAAPRQQDALKDKINQLLPSSVELLTPHHAGNKQSIFIKDLSTLKAPIGKVKCSIHSRALSINNC